MLDVGYKTDKGLTRSRNEDACIALSSESVYVVADGVGGSNAGEIASETAIVEVCDFLRKKPIEDIHSEKELGKYIKDCINEANASVFAMGQKYPETSGLATTMVLCHVRGDRAYFANVGDSRAYLFREDTLFQVTEDHSYVMTLVDLGLITKEQAKDHERGNIITRAVGAEADIKADLYQMEIRDGDVILLCTDGYYDEVSDDETIELIKEHGEMGRLADVMVDTANEHGGRDNITVIAIKITEADLNEQ